MNKIFYTTISIGILLLTCSQDVLAQGFLRKLMNSVVPTTSTQKRGLTSTNFNHEDFFSKIQKDDIWTKHGDEYRIITIDVEWPQDLIHGDVQRLQKEICQVAFKTQAPIEDAIQTYIGSLGEVVTTPNNYHGEMEYNGCLITNYELTIKKEAYKEGSYIVYSVCINEIARGSAYVSGGNYQYVIFDLKDDKFLTNSDIISDYKVDYPELMRNVEKYIKEDDKNILDGFSDKPLDFSGRIFMKEDSIVFTFVGYHSWEVRVVAPWQSFKAFLTDRAKTYYNDN